MFVKPEADRLEVRMTLPIVALADANLPRGADRKLAHPDVDRVLLVVARDLSNRLEWRDNDQPLATPAMAATVAADEQSVTFLFVYPTHADRGRLSAQLQTFQAGSTRIRAVAHFGDGGRTRTYSIAGAPERIFFEPATSAVLASFAGRGLTFVSAGGDFLLFLILLAIPLRPAVERWRAGLWFIGIQFLAAMTAALVAAPPPTATPAILLPPLAASAIVMVAVVDLVAPRSPRMRLVAALFGALNGYALGQAFHASSEFAGTHTLVGAATFAVTVSVLILAILPLLTFAATTLVERGIAASWLTIAVAVYAGHNALHRLSDRLPLEPTSVWWIDRLATLLVVGWVAAILAFAVADAIRSNSIKPAPTAEGTR